MKNTPITCILVLLNMALALSTCAQEAPYSIDFSDEEHTTFLKYKENFQPKLSKEISENRMCYISRFEDQVFIASITDSYVEGVYHNTIHIRHIDSFGNSLWHYVLDNYDRSSFKDIYATSDGVYLMYEGYLNPKGLSRDCFLLKLNLAGQRVWQIDFGKKYGTADQDMMKLDAEGNLIACNKHFETSFIYKIAPNGEVLETARFTAKSELTMMDFDFDESGNIYAIGQITSYPEKKYTQEVFIYKLDKNFEPLKQEIKVMGTVSIANSIKYVGNGHFALHISSHIDHNLETIDKMFSQFSLMDTDLNVTNVSRFRTDGTGGSHQRFKKVTDDSIIAYDRIYWNGTSYYMLLEFNRYMVYKQSTLFDFSTGLSDFTYMPNGDMVWVKFHEKLLVFDGL